MAFSSILEDEAFYTLFAQEAGGGLRNRATVLTITFYIAAWSSGSSSVSIRNNSPEMN